MTPRPNSLCDKGCHAEDDDAYCIKCGIEFTQEDYIIALETDLAAAKQEITDWEASFALYDAALARGTKKWRAAHPETNIFPDTGKMMNWFTDQLDAENERIEELEACVKAVEWDNEGIWCPWCGGSEFGFGSIGDHPGEPPGHTNDCQRQKALGEGEE